MLLLGFAQTSRAGDDDAPALLRRADETTYLPAKAGVKTLQCAVRYRMTNGTVRRMAFAFRADATPPSHVDRVLDAGEKDWDSGESEERYGGAIDLLVWKDWRAMTAGCELATRRDGDRTVVVVKSGHGDFGLNTGDEISFLPEGPVEWFGAAKPKGEDVNVRRTYDREGDLYLAKSGVLIGYGGGFEKWTYVREKGRLLPRTYTMNCGGLGGTFVFDDWRVDEELIAVRGRVDETVAELAAELADPDTRVRLRAAGQLQRRGEAAADAAPALAQVVREFADPSARESRDGALLARTAIATLASCGEKAAEATDTFVALLGDADPAIADGALRCLVVSGKTPAAATPALAAMLAKPWPKDGPDAVRTRWIVAAIWNSGPAAESAIPALVTLLDARCVIAKIPAEFHPGDFRDAAADLLATLRPASLAALIERLKQPVVALSDHFAGRAIAAMGDDAKIAVRAFIDELAEADAVRRTRAIHALRNIGAVAAEATPQLVTILHDDPDAKIRGYAAWALSWVGAKDPAAAQAVVTAWREGRISGEILTVPSRRTQLDDTMYAFCGTAVVPLVAAVREMKDDPRGADAAYLLGHCGAEAVPALVALAGDPDVTIAVRAIHAMGTVIGDSATPELIKLLASEDELRAAAAIDALVVNSFPAKPALQDVVARRPAEDVVRRRAEEALLRMKAK